MSEEQGLWEGRQPRVCGDHRTTGSRAWCYDCSEWCYEHPDGQCKGCRLASLESDNVRLQGERDDSNRRLAMLLRVDNPQTIIDSSIGALEDALADKNRWRDRAEQAEQQLTETKAKMADLQQANLSFARSSALNVDLQRQLAEAREENERLRDGKETVGDALVNCIRCHTEMTKLNFCITESCPVKTVYRDDALLQVLREMAGYIERAKLLLGRLHQDQGYTFDEAVRWLDDLNRGAALTKARPYLEQKTK